MQLVTMTCYKRAAYTRRVVRALATCPEAVRCHLEVFAEPGHPDVVAAFDGYPHPHHVNINPNRLGCNANTRQALTWGFRRSRFLIHLEDDTLPGRDALSFLLWARDRFEASPAVRSVCAYRRHREAAATYGATRYQRWFTPWVWGTWRDRWEGLGRIRPRGRSWDTQIAESWGDDRLEVVPAISRADNIGAEEGEHTPSPEWHRQHHALGSAAALTRHTSPHEWIVPPYELHHHHLIGG